MLVCVGVRERQKGRGGYREPEREDKEKDIMALQSCDYGFRFINTWGGTPAYSRLYLGEIVCMCVCENERNRQKGRGRYREPEREDKEKDIMAVELGQWLPVHKHMGWDGCVFETLAG